MEEFKQTRGKRPVPWEATLQTKVGPIRVKVSCNNLEDWEKLKWAIYSDAMFSHEFLHGIVLPVTDRKTPRLDLLQKRFMRHMKIQAALLGYVRKMIRINYFKRQDVRNIARTINGVYGSMEHFRRFDADDAQNFKKRWITAGQKLLVVNTIESRSLLTGLLRIQHDLLDGNKDDLRLPQIYNLTCAAIAYFMPGYFKGKGRDHFEYMDENLFRTYRNVLQGVETKPFFPKCRTTPLAKM